MAEKAVTKTAVSVFAGFIESLVGNQTISADVGAAVNAALNHRASEVEAAVAALKTKSKE